MTRTMLPCLLAFSSAWTASAQPARVPDGVKARRDIPYVTDGHERNVLDLFVPENVDGPLPLIIWIHGGGWQNGSKENCLPLRLGREKAGRILSSTYAVVYGDVTSPCASPLPRPTSPGCAGRGDIALRSLGRRGDRSRLRPTPLADDQQHSGVSASHDHSAVVGLPSWLPQRSWPTGRPTFSLIPAADSITSPTCSPPCPARLPSSTLATIKPLRRPW